VDELDLAVVLAVPPPAHAGLQTADVHVDPPLGMLEWAIGVACLRRGRQVALLATVFQLAAVTLPVLVVIIVLASTLVVAAVVVVVT
jgi:hypothetical protein